MELGPSRAQDGSEVTGRGQAVGQRGAGLHSPKVVRVLLENPVSILSAEVTGCEWVDSACIRFNK